MWCKHKLYKQVSSDIVPALSNNPVRFVIRLSLEWFSIECGKLKNLSNHSDQSGINTNSAMNQSEFEANTCTVLSAGKLVREGRNWF